jgi:hypothetical protein
MTRIETIAALVASGSAETPHSQSKFTTQLASTVTFLEGADVLVLANQLRIAVRIIESQAKQLAAKDLEPEHIDAMAVWEEIGNDRVARDKLPGEGALEHRQYVAFAFTPFCVKWYTYATVFLGYDECFDWEFVPRFTGALSTFDVNELSGEAIGTALDAVVAEFNRPENS